MEIIVKGLPSAYEAEHLARVFYPGAALRSAGGTGGDAVYARAGRSHMAAGLRLGGAVYARRAAYAAKGPMAGQSVKTQLCRLLYTLLCETTGRRPPWGMLTGVRPLNLLRKKQREGGEEAARRHFIEVCGVSEGRYEMARGIERRQRPILAKSGARSYSLYVSVPFCPTRCAYCSFVSRTVASEGHLLPEYLEKLGEELAETAAIAKSLGLRLATVYIGGGTPTSPDAAGLDRLLACVERHFGAAGAAEYTVEAGRPDCTDAEKLAILKARGVSRISVNPQSLNDAVLRAIGRRHTAADVLRCFEDARAAGHENINMDLIAGLEGDSGQSFAATLSRVLELAPESVTLHALTLKRASDMAAEGRGGALPARWLGGAYPALEGAGYAAYYLYRQKSGVQSLENTGWAKAGREGLYNVYIMEEAHTVLACGAGAVTKLVGGGGRTIRRIYNRKLPADYIRDIDRAILLKRGVIEFYAGNLDTEATG